MTCGLCYATGRQSSHQRNLSECSLRAAQASQHLSSQRHAEIPVFRVQFGDKCIRCRGVVSLSMKTSPRITVRRAFSQQESFCSRIHQSLHETACGCSRDCPSMQSRPLPDCIFFGFPLIPSKLKSAIGAPVGEQND